MLSRVQKCKHYEKIPSITHSTAPQSSTFSVFRSNLYANEALAQPVFKSVFDTSNSNVN